MTNATLSIMMDDGAARATQPKQVRTRRTAIIAGSIALTVAIGAFVLTLFLVPERTKEIVAVFVIVIGALVAWSGTVLVLLTARPTIKEVTASTDDVNTKMLREVADLIQALSKLTPAVAVAVVGALIVGMGLWFW